MIDTVVDKLVDRIVYAAPVEWTEHWLNGEVIKVFESFPLKGKLEIIPFFNDLAHYASQYIATDNGHLPINHIMIMVEECLDELHNRVWDQSYQRLTERHGKPRDSWSTDV